MICNQYLEDFKIDLLRLGYASVVRRGWQASAMESIKGKWFPPLHKLNATLFNLHYIGNGDDFYEAETDVTII